MGLDFGGLFRRFGIRSSKRIKVISISPPQFTSENPDTDNYILTQQSYIQCQANGIMFNAPIVLPHNARFIRAKFYGNAGAEAETWAIARTLNTSAAALEIIFSGVNFNSSAHIVTRDKEFIDNYNYRYYIVTSTMDTGDQILGGWIEYEVDEDL